MHNTISEQRVDQMIAARILKLSLAKAMKSSGRYEDDCEIVNRILEMRHEVRNHDLDPEEVLHEEGFEPDYVFDLI